MAAPMQQSTCREIYLNMELMRSVPYVHVRLLASFISVWTLLSTNYVQGRTLKLAHVLYRHGARSPAMSYPNDPYQEDSWPGGFGQLTERGMIEQYELGKWLRKRYVTDQRLLNATYVRRELKVISTDHDRTIMSADANLQGLYPREKVLGKGTDFLWKPIPVFTLPTESDTYLHLSTIVCPRLKQLDKNRDILREKYIAENQGFLDSVKEKAGIEDNMDFRRTRYLADTFHFEKVDGRTLPEWVTDNILQRLMDAMDYYYVITFTNQTAEYRRLTSGNLLGQIILNLKNYTTGIDNQTKLVMYSAHDSTIAALLCGLGFQVTKHPPTASCVLIELYQETDGTYTVDVYFRNQTDSPLNTMVMPGCSEHCPLEEFYNLIKEIIPKDFQAECKRKVLLQGFEWSNKGWMIAFVSVILCVVLAFIMITLVLFSSHRRKQRIRERQMKPINIHLLGHHASESEEDESVFDT